MCHCLHAMEEKKNQRKWMTILCYKGRGQLCRYLSSNGRDYKNSKTHNANTYIILPNIMQLILLLIAE